MLEAIREYSIEKMEQGGEAAETRHRHAHYYLSLAEMANAHFTGPQDPGWGAKQIEWVDRLESELGNMRAALDWYQARAEDDKNAGMGMPDNLQQGLRLTTALGRVWFGRGHVSEGLERTMGAASDSAKARADGAAQAQGYLRGSIDGSGQTGPAAWRRYIGRSRAR